MIINLTALVVTVSLLAGLVIAAVIALRIIFRKFSELSSQNRLLKALRNLDQLALSNAKIESLFQGIVDVIHKELGFTFAVFALLDKEAKLIRRVAISLDPESVADLQNILPVQFHQQIVALSNKENLFTKVILEKRARYTKNLADIQVGVLPEEVSREIQRRWRLKSIFVHPVLIRGEALGILEYASTKEKDKHSDLEVMIIESFTQEASRVLENAYLYQDLRVTTKQLQVANQRLRELDQLKDDFVSIASHELRTPMTAIRSYAWMALHRSDVPLSKTLEKYVARILLSTERLINLVNDMLNVSRIESGRIEINPEPVDLISLTKDIIDELYYSKSPEKKVEFVVLEKPFPRVLADPEKLRQVFLNLVGNSLKFTPAGGKITFDFFTDGKVVETLLRDTGVGMSKEDLSKLFSKFGRLDNSYTAAATSGGTGLGLYISKNLVELMHGKIWANSEGFNKGATFIVSLPVATPDTLKNIDRYRVKPKGEVKGLEPVAI